MASHPSSCLSVLSCEVNRNDCNASCLLLYLEQQKRKLMITVYIVGPDPSAGWSLGLFLPYRRQCLLASHKARLHCGALHRSSGDPVYKHRMT